MNVKKLIKKPIGSTKIDYFVTVGPDEVGAAIDKAIEIIAKTSYIYLPEDQDGEQIIRKAMGDQQADFLIKNHVMGRLSPYVINDEADLNLAFEPQCTSSEMPKRGEDFEFVIHALLKPKYTLTSFDPVEVTVPRYRVPEEAIDRQIEQLAQMNTSYKKTDDKGEPVELGQHILIDMETTKNGEKIGGLTGEGRLLEMSYDFMPKDFIDHLLGMKVGETREFDFEGPREGATSIDDTETFHTKVTVTEFQKQIVPKISNAWIEVNLPDAGTVEGLRAQIREQLEGAAEQQSNSDLSAMVDAALAERFDGKISDEIYESAAGGIYQQTRQSLQQQGKTLEQFMQETGMSQEQVNMQVMLQARDMIRQGFALDKLYDELIGELTDEDLEEAYHAFAPGHEEEAKQQFAESGRDYAVREVAKRLKAHKYLVEHATINYRDVDMPQEMLQQMSMMPGMGMFGGMPPMR